MGDTTKGDQAFPGVSQVPQTALPWSCKEHIPYPGIPAKLLQVTAGIPIPVVWDTDTATFTPPCWDYFYLVLFSYGCTATTAGCLAKLQVPHEEGK